MDSSEVTEAVFMQFLTKEIMSHVPHVSFDINYRRSCDVIGADEVNGQLIRECIKGLIDNLIDDYSLAEDSFWSSHIVNKLKSN